METKKYWQAKDADSRAFIYNGEPLLVHGKTYHTTNGTNCTPDFLFPIPLKPLQIAEITVCSDGTWSYEIEREEGWYFARNYSSGDRGIVMYKDGKYLDVDGKRMSVNIKDYTISSTRIPDECII